MPVTISSNFDSGAIEVLSAAGAADITLHIRKDSHADFRQWFHFRLSDARGTACTLRFENAGACTYPDGWKDYRAVASYDRERWFRVPTRFEGGVMTVEHTPERDAVWYAYFEPYSWERHQALIGRAGESPLVRVERLGATVEGRDLDLLSVRGENGEAPKTVWIIARQHPGESMAEWFVEGLVERLLDRADPVSRRLLERAVFHIVPNMNPDGAVRGNLRTNAAGANLNREWMNPSLETSPEVFRVRERLQQTGVDAFFDIHGDEALPYVFVAGGEMLPGFTPEQSQAQSDFIASFKRASPDFQDVHGYGAGKYREDALKLASKWVGHTHGCLALTLEMPFKDNANLPDRHAGWSGERSRKLGAAMLEPLLASL
ncbi:MAG TPA: M14-type cytosolic carboxypeptidase, partial [Burkholderiales bacterium]|nr:M14-type cytosolic carboxypeptidase [Burkholderiales bacterium]